MKLLMNTKKRVPLWFVGILLLSAIPVGIGLYLFIYAKGYSYLTNDPQTCMNCHVMRDQFSSWNKASHHTIASCQDCHMSGSLPNKIKIKISNGFWHSWAFTTVRFKEPIQIKLHNLKIVENSCLSCHDALLKASNMGEHQNKNISCLQCHRDVGHVK